jgi:hypothetical protein
LNTIFIHPRLVAVFSKETERATDKCPISLLDKMDQSIEGICSCSFVIILKVVRVRQKIVRRSLQILERRGYRERRRRCRLYHGEVVYVIEEEGKLLLDTKAPSKFEMRE